MMPKLKKSIFLGLQSKLLNNAKMKLSNDCELDRTITKKKFYTLSDL